MTHRSRHMLEVLLFVLAADFSQPALGLKEFAPLLFH
jgi:hypothetical protein